MADPDFGGQQCCILEICCGGEEQIAALAAKIEQETPLNKQHARTLAIWIITHYDLAPVGTLKAFKRAIADLAREYPPSPGY